jgi:hypothetical protein
MAGMAGSQKLSLHSSGICRQAYTQEEMSDTSESDRVHARWRRRTKPYDGITYALVVGFPSDFLSTSLKLEPKQVRWIPASPLGGTTLIEFVFNTLGPDSIENFAQRHGRTIVDYAVLPNGEMFVVTWLHTEWRGEAFTIPGIFGYAGNYVVSRHDPLNTGRPARFTLFLPPERGRQHMHVDEFGAYAAPAGLMLNEPMGRFTPNPGSVRRGRLKR